MTVQDRDLDTIRSGLRADVLADEDATLARLIETANLSAEERRAVGDRAVALVEAVRAAGGASMMQSFLTEYGLSTREGVALMCLAEALLRVPDDETIDALIEDKIAPSDWGTHLGRSSSSLVNASTWALMLTGRVLDDEDKGLAGVLRGAVKRLGEPVIRTAVGQAMREMGRQFVLGRDIEEAMRRASRLEAKGYTYSYDMLGEAARTEADARGYLLHYAHAISAIAPRCTAADIRDNPGISVKLSALSPRYEVGQKLRVMREVVPRAKALAHVAAAAGMGFNIDAEEQERLDLSLDIIEEVLKEPGLEGWDGFGVVVQAYGPRAPHVIDWLATLARWLDRRIMVRLVKGAYWDTEVKRAQVLGLDGFPVFTRKVTTDVCYLACTEKLLGHADRIYPQFATHNAHTVAAVRHMAERAGNLPYEFQKLHGMGDELYAEAMREPGTRVRVYAPVGAHRDLLAYLVRRLLENGANSSFVHQIVDEAVSPREIARDPIEAAERLNGSAANPNILRGPDLFAPARRNAGGWDLTDPVTVAGIETGRSALRTHKWHAGPLLARGDVAGAGEAVANPADPADHVGTVRWATAEDVEHALDTAGAGADAWGATTAAERAAALRAVADAYEAEAATFFAVCAREAGKTPADVVAEIREAVDFLRYYAAEAERLEAGGRLAPRGVIACISPWNFPLAIFTGQIAAALAAGNAVLAKPAEQTPLTAAEAVRLMHGAGVPRSALQLLPGGGEVGASLTSDPRIDGVAFTGSTATAKRIDRALAEANASDAMLVAETGGLNAMIVDSTALPEQAVHDVIASSFQSAGQRCSACRMLYVQEDVAERVIDMLQGAMDALSIGDPWLLSTDVGPVIDAEAKADIDAYVETARAEGRLTKRLDLPRAVLEAGGHFVAPALVRVRGIEDLEREVFGPVLHVATYGAAEIDAVIDRINAKGYGLTFGLHTRIDDRVSQIVSRVRAGNVYVNRNQIGAIVGSQPFGGEGLSGTGPKAGGPDYVARFCRPAVTIARAEGAEGRALAAETIGKALADLAVPAAEPEADAVSLPGPTGESNRLRHVARGRVLCLGPDAATATAQAARAREAGNAVLVAAPDAAGFGIAQDAHTAVLDGTVPAEVLEMLTGVDAVAHDGPEAARRTIRRALAARDGAIVPLLSANEGIARWRVERHVCIDTTAAGGNASLMAEAGED